MTTINLSEISDNDLLKELSDRIKDLGDIELYEYFEIMLNMFNKTVKEVRLTEPANSEPVPKEQPEKVYRYSATLMDVSDILEENNPEWIRNNKIRYRGSDDKCIHIMCEHGHIDGKEIYKYYKIEYNPEGAFSKEDLKVFRNSYEFLK